MRARVAEETSCGGSSSCSLRRKGKVGALCPTYFWPLIYQETAPWLNGDSLQSINGCASRLLGQHGYGELRHVEEARKIPCHKLRQVVAGSPPPRPWFNPRSGHVGFVVDKVALRHVFPECFRFPCQF
jgi:hypothetical protein